MADSQTFLEAAKVLGFVFGGGGLATVLVAWLNRKPAAPPAPAPTPTSPVPPEWLIQHIIQIELDIQGIKRAVDTQTHAVTTMAVQVNSMADFIRRLGAWLRRRLKTAEKGLIDPKG